MDGVRPSIILDNRKEKKKKSKSKWCGIKVGPRLLSSRMRFLRCSRCLTPEDGHYRSKMVSTTGRTNIKKEEEEEEKFLEKSICSRLERYKDSQHCTRHGYIQQSSSRRGLYRRLYCVCIPANTLVSYFFLSLSIRRRLCVQHPIAFGRLFVSYTIKDKYDISIVAFIIIA